MRLYTLVEEHAADPTFVCEHGLSFYLETEREHLLFDLGQSELFLRNAHTLGLDIARVDRAFLSHGHYDHAGGLGRFFACNDHAKVYARPSAGGAYFSTSLGEPRFIGVSRDVWEGQRERFETPEGLFQLFDGAWLVPETVHGGPFASRETNLLRQEAAGGFVPDDFSHEHSLVLFNSCSHGGIVNIVRGVKEQLGRPVYAVFGGLHLFSAKAASGMNCTPEYALSVADALTAEGVERIYTGHCTGQAAFALLQDRLGEGLQALTTGLCVTLE